MTKKQAPKTTERTELKPGELMMYITLFKIVGHKTWRLHLGQDANHFDNYIKGDPKFPEITARKVFTLDRFTGEVSATTDI